MEKIVSMLNKLAEKRASHPAIKALSERVNENIAVAIDLAKVITGVDSTDAEDISNKTEEATKDAARMMQLELLWDIRDSLTVSTPDFAPVAASEPGEHEFNILAGELYEEYCSGVGAVAFNGDPLPSWEEFRADPSKNKQSDAWMQVAGKAIAILA